MREEIARLVHDVDGRLAIRNSHVHVQSEDQVRPRDLLHVFHDLLVALAFRDELIAPVRERMRAGGGDLHPAPAPRARASWVRNSHDMRARIDDRLADLGARIRRPTGASPA